MMDVELLSRLQFAGTIMFHYLFTLGTMMIGVSALACWFWYRETYHERRWLMWAIVTMPLAAIVPHATNVTLYSARSSHQTLTTMLWIAIIGMPCVASYTITIYWIFRGKVKLDSNSY